MKIHPVGGGLEMDGKMDVTKLIAGFHYFANASNEIEQKLWYS